MSPFIALKVVYLLFVIAFNLRASKSDSFCYRNSCNVKNLIQKMKQTDNDLYWCTYLKFSLYFFNGIYPLFPKKEKVIESGIIKEKQILFVYQQALIRTFHTSFWTTKSPLWIHSTRTQIQKVILCSKTGLRFGMTNSINKHHKKVKNSVHTQHNLLTFNDH